MAVINLFLYWEFKKHHLSCDEWRLSRIDLAGRQAPFDCGKGVKWQGNTHFTRERLLSVVHSHVIFQIRVIGKAVLAFRTTKLFLLVYTYMGSQIGFRGKIGRAHPTHVFTRAVHSFLVICQCIRMSARKVRDTTVVNRGGSKACNEYTCAIGELEI